MNWVTSITYQVLKLFNYAAQSTRVTEYTDCISAEGYDSINRSSGYDIKQSDSDAPASKIWRIQGTLSLPLLAGSLLPGVVSPETILFIDQIEQTVFKQTTIYVKLWLLYSNTLRRFPWCNGYCRRKRIGRHEFKSWTRLIAFHIALIPLGKVWIQLCFLQLWVNSRAYWVLQSWLGN